MRQPRIAGLFLTGLVACNCAPSKLDVRPVSYDVDVRLEPRTNNLEAQVSIELERIDAGSREKRARLELLLHPELGIGSVEMRGATLRSHKQRTARPRDDGDIEPTRHRLTVEHPAETLFLKLAYRGTLHQDVGAGEKEGQIHNFAVSAHVGEEGLYLEPSGYWYPRVELPDDSEPGLTLADYTLSVRPVEGFELVAGAERATDREDGSLRWMSPFPLDGLVLLGGPLERASRRHGDVDLHAVLAPGKEEVAQDILDASAEYLDRYEELIGPYPFTEFTVLEAFFSSGFAFPTCTQIAGSQLSEYKQYRRHGYLDHELLHNWYGNGIFVDPRDGNWCEGLASYMGNYYGFVMEGDEKGARKQRRNQSNFQSAIDADKDKPLGTFGLDDGAGRGIGYQKAASVFHMLERKIGRDAMFAALRRLTAEQMGKYTSWEDLKAVFEGESGVELDTFFTQWVRGSGAPLLELVDADYRPGEDRVSITLSQGATDFELEVPVRLHYGDRSEDVAVRLNERVDTIEVPCDPSGLTAVELDPDYHLFRKLKPDEIMPTSSLTRRAEKLLIVVPEGELAEGYQVVFDAGKRAVLGDEEPKKGHEVLVRAAHEVEYDELTSSSVLILGEAVRRPAVQRLLEDTRSPVVWHEDGFAIEEADYSGARQAVYLTVHHPDVPEGGVTVYYGNSPEALSNAGVLGFYANSLLVFETPEGSTEVGAADAMPRAEVIRRMDFEFHERIDF